MKILPNMFSGKLIVGRWSGHGEGGTVAEVKLNTPSDWMYDLPTEIKQQIGNGIDVATIPMRDVEFIIGALRCQVRHDEMNLPYLHKENPPDVKTTQLRMARAFGLILDLGRLVKS